MKNFKDKMFYLEKLIKSEMRYKKLKNSPWEKTSKFENAI